MSIGRRSKSYRVDDDAGFRYVLTFILLCRYILNKWIKHNSPGSLLAEHCK